MKAVIQRVLWAKVEVEGEIVGQIERGFLTLLGFSAGDSTADIDRLMLKISKLRAFEDEQGKMNLSLAEVQGGHLLVSQFTLCADLSKGNRPSFLSAAAPAIAEPLFDYAVKKSHELGMLTAQGQFQANMQITLLNDGPVTFVIDELAKGFV